MKETVHSKKIGQTVLNLIRRKSCKSCSIEIKVGPLGHNQKRTNY